MMINSVASVSFAASTLRKFRKALQAEKKGEEDLKRAQQNEWTNLVPYYDQPEPPITKIPVIKLTSQQLQSLLTLDPSTIVPANVAKKTMQIEDTVKRLGTLISELESKQKEIEARFFEKTGKKYSRAVWDARQEERVSEKMRKNPDNPGLARVPGTTLSAQQVHGLLSLKPSHMYGTGNIAKKIVKFEDTIMGLRASISTLKAKQKEIGQG